VFSREVVNGDDIRVIEGRGRSCFLKEPLFALERVETVWWEHFDRDGPMQSRIDGAVHLAHPARAKLGTDLVRAEAAAGGERYRGTARLCGRAATLAVDTACAPVAQLDRAPAF
jgi:hypothetical protein